MKNYRDKIYDWDILTNSDLYKEIIENWESLLKNKDGLERHYHKFIQDNPYFFFSHEDCYLVISKLKLGDYETDFVLVKEGYSSGTIYELVELQSPHTKLFNQNGVPSEELNSGLQQVRDWRRFLMEDKAFFKKNFPTISTKIIKDSRIKFSIIIGNASYDKEELEKRQQLSEEAGINIYSYDRLTNILKGRQYFPDRAEIYSSEFGELDYNIQNQLGNPFAKSISHSDWRTICKRGDAHIYARLAEEIIEIRENNEYFERFKLLAKQ